MFASGNFSLYAHCLPFLLFDFAFFAKTLEKLTKIQAITVGKLLAEACTG